MLKNVIVGILFSCFAVFVYRTTASVPKVETNPSAAPVVIYAPTQTAPPSVIFYPTPEQTVKPSIKPLPTIPPLKDTVADYTPRPLPTMVQYDAPVYKPIQYTDKSNQDQSSDPIIITKDPTKLADCLANVEAWKQEQITNGMNVDDETNPLNRILIGKKADCEIRYGNP